MQAITTLLLFLSPLTPVGATAPPPAAPRAAPPIQVHVLPLDNADAVDVAAWLADLQRRTPILVGPSARYLADVPTNSIIVLATGADFRALRALVQVADRPRRAICLALELRAPKRAEPIYSGRVQTLDSASIDLSLPGGQTVELRATRGPAPVFQLHVFEPASRPTRHPRHGPRRNSLRAAVGAGQAAVLTLWSGRTLSVTPRSGVCPKRP